MTTRYNEHAAEMKKGHGLAVVKLILGKAIRNSVQGLGDLAEARRVVIAHAEFEAKEKAMHDFRLFRPPNLKAGAGAQVRSATSGGVLPKMRPIGTHEPSAEDRAIFLSCGVRPLRCSLTVSWQALEKSPFYEDPESEETKQKRAARFAPVTNLLYADGLAARKLRLRRLGHSSLLYAAR